MDQQKSQLEYHLKVLWKGKWLILATTMIASILVVVFSLSKPSSQPYFDAFATVKVEPVSSLEALDSFSSVSPPDERSLNTQIQLIGSRNVMERALELLNSEQGTVTPGLMATQVVDLQLETSVRAIPNTNLLEVRASDTSPARAQAKANAVVAAYIDYVKEERTLAIQEALKDINDQLQGAQRPNSLRNSQLVVLLPTLGVELTSIARSVEKSIEQVQAVKTQENHENVRYFLNQEMPQIERSSAELSVISRDLQELKDDLLDSEKQRALLGNKPLAVEAIQLEKVANELSVELGQLRHIRTKVQQIDPLSAFATATSHAEDALVSLRRVPLELRRVGVRSFSNSRQLGTIETYTESVIEDLEDMSVRLERASKGVKLEQDERVLLRGQLLAHTLGLKEALIDLEEIRTETNVQDISARDVTGIAASEGHLKDAVSEIGLISKDLDSTANVESVSDGLAQVLGWVNEMPKGLLEVSESFRGLESIQDTVQNQRVSTLSSQEIESISLTLEVAINRLRSLQARINDPLLQLQLNVVTGRLAASQQEIAGVAARLSTATQVQPVATIVEGIEAVQERLQHSSDALMIIVDSWQPGDDLPGNVFNADSAASLYAETLSVVRALEVLNSQFLNLVSINVDPLLGAELDEVANRLVLTYDGLEQTSDNLNMAVENGTPAFYRRLEVAAARMRSASNVLMAAAEISQQDLSEADAGLILETTAEFQEQVEIAAAILSLVADDLIGIQLDEAAPVRYGQLSLLSGRIESAASESSNVSAQIQQIQDGRGASYFNLQQLRAELEVSLLQPQETGINLVDSAVSSRGSSSGSGFFSQLGIPAAIMAGMLLGSIAVLIREQLNQTVSSPIELREQLDLTTLGVVPKGKSSGVLGMPFALESDSSVFSEALQSIGARLSGPSCSGVHSLLLASANAAEGKTMLAVNLARVFSQYGHRVLLVDANLRKPEVAKALGLPDGEGLVDALAQQRSPLDYIVETDTFSVLPGGKRPLNPVELLSSATMTFFLGQVKTKYDMVLVDGPPIVGFAETKVMARSVDAAVIVVKAGSTNINLVKGSRDELEEAGATVVGSVLNFAPEEEWSHLKNVNYGYHVNGTGGAAAAKGKRRGILTKAKVNRA